MYERLLMICRYILYINFLWLLLVLIKPSVFFFFAKPEAKWKRLKAIGLFVGVFLCLTIIVSIIHYIYDPGWLINQLKYLLG